MKKIANKKLQNEMRTGNRDMGYIQFNRQAKEWDPDRGEVQEEEGCHWRRIWET